MRKMCTTNIRYQFEIYLNLKSCIRLVNVYTEGLFLTVTIFLSWVFFLWWTANIYIKKIFKNSNVKISNFEWVAN